jgi:hypothetical protein
MNEQKWNSAGLSRVLCGQLRGAAGRLKRKDNVEGRAVSPWSGSEASEKTGPHPGEYDFGDRRPTLLRR